MAERKHTPAPWSVEPGDSVVVIRANNAPLAITSTKKYWQNYDDTDLANAHLIAAAPDMFEALERTRDNFIRLLEQKPVRDAAETLSEADRALSRARGDTP